MAVTRDQWIAIWDVAGATVAVTAGSGTPGTAVVGRFISTLVEKVVRFWGDHRATLAPVLAQIAIAALDALVQALPEIVSVNTPGPG